MFEVDLAERARHLLSIVRDALQAPGEDPVVTVVVVAIFALVAMVLAVIAIIVYVELRPATSRPAVQVLKRRSHVARTTAQSVGWTLVAIGVIVAAGVGLRVANAPPTCARCHTGPPEALERTVHASVACGKCHTRPGLTGSIERQISYAREVTVHIVGLRRTETPDPDGLPAVRSPSTAYPGPSSSSCLRCHRSVLRGVVVSAGVRMEHAHVLAAGGRCPDCHVGIAHPGAVERPRYSRMEACMLCHDARQAPAECTFCHEGDIGLVSRVAGARPAPEIDVPAPQHCRGCHSETVQQGCIDCHGLELPHPPAWTEEVTHARPGFVDRDNCLRCHDERRYCNRCHRFPSLHQPTARWVGLHGRAAQGRASVPYNIASCVFSECHSDQFCDLCHDGRRVTAPSGLYRQPCHSSAGSARDELVLIPLDSACH